MATMLGQPADPTHNRVDQHGRLVKHGDAVVEGAPEGAQGDQLALERRQVAEVRTLGLGHAYLAAQRC